MLNQRALATHGVAVLEKDAKEERKKSWRERSPWKYENWFHPTSEDRLKMLSNGERLFRLQWQLPFLTGILLGIFFVTLPLIVGYLLLPPFAVVELALLRLAQDILLLPGGMFLYIVSIIFLRILPLSIVSIILLWSIVRFLTTSLGTQLQRETIALLDAGQSYFRSYMLSFVHALLLSAGVIIGIFLIPSPFKLTLRQLLTPTVILTMIAWCVGLIRGNLAVAHTFASLDTGDFRHAYRLSAT